MNKLQEIAYTVKNYYYEGFIREYIKEKKKILQLSNGNENVQNQYKIETDCILNPDYKKDVKLIDIDNRPSDQIGKFYRDDFGVFLHRVLVKTILYYPVLTYKDDEFVEEDIPIFESCRGKIKQTEVEVQSFPWFQCQITLHGNVYAIYGILDKWFLEILLQVLLKMSYIGRMDHNWNYMEGSHILLILGVRHQRLFYI